MKHPKGCRKHRLCILNVLKHLLDELEIGPDKVLAVGDSENDVCLLEASGISVAFQPKTVPVRDCAKHVIGGDLRGILSLIGQPVPEKPEIRQTPIFSEKRLIPKRNLRRKQPSTTTSS
jgi:hypothetical protein